MPFSWEEAAFMSYSSGFGACYVEKSVSTECTPPAHPINTEYQWHKCAGQAPRHFSSSAVKKMPPWTDAVPSTLMRDPGSLHWKLHPSGINCLPDCSRTKKPTTMLSVCFLVITVTLGFGVLVPFVFYIFGLVFCFFVCFGFLLVCFLLSLALTGINEVLSHLEITRPNYTLAAKLSPEFLLVLALC